MTQAVATLSEGDSRFRKDQDGQRENAEKAGNRFLGPRAEALNRRRELRQRVVVVAPRLEAAGCQQVEAAE